MNQEDNDSINAKSASHLLSNIMFKIYCNFITLPFKTLSETVLLAKSLLSVSETSWAKQALSYSFL